MRVVADTNILISGLLWKGSAYEVLKAAQSETIYLFTSMVLLEELEDVLERKKFKERMDHANLSVRELVLGYAALATVIKPKPIAPVILKDPDDDAVLACASAAKADRIVSGDKHLLLLKKYKGIQIITSTQLLHQISSE